MSLPAAFYSAGKALIIELVAAVAATNRMEVEK
jgi:hypothetical protein